MTTTAAPSAARCFAIAAPMPLDAPVTTATLPESFLLLIFVKCWRGASRLDEVEKAGVELLLAQKLAVLIYLAGTSTGASLSFTKNTTNFAGLVWLAFRPTT